MSKHGKRYFNALKKAPKKEVTLEEAVKFVKDNAGAKFDETVDVYFHLGKELTKGDTAVRGTVKLPNGSGKTVKVAVFAGGDAAEAAKAAFGKIKEKLPPGSGGKGPFVLATVQGDIHDIGKNIVGLLLENYGYTVIDLGKDVPPEAVLEAVRFDELLQDADAVITGEGKIDRQSLYGKAISGVANAVKTVPDEMINDASNGVTEEFLRYARPLIEGELYPQYENGLPKYLKLDKTVKM